MRCPPDGPFSFFVFFSEGSSSVPFPPDTEASCEPTCFPRVFSSCPFLMSPCGHSAFISGSRRSYFPSFFRFFSPVPLYSDERYWSETGPVLAVLKVLSILFLCFSLGPLVSRTFRPPVCFKQSHPTVFWRMGPFATPSFLKHSIQNSWQRRDVDGVSSPPPALS